MILDIYVTLKLLFHDKPLEPILREILQVHWIKATFIMPLQENLPGEVVLHKDISIY